MWKKAICLSLLSGLFAPACADELFTSMRAHRMPYLFKIKPLYDPVNAGGEMPYTQPGIGPEPGVMSSVLDAFRPVKLGFSYNAATGGWETFAKGLLKTPDYFAKLVLVDESGADDYETAAGNNQRFGYDRRTGQLVLGWTPAAGEKLAFAVVRDSIDDNKMPLGKPVRYGSFMVLEGYGQDPIETDRTVYKLLYHNDAEQFGAFSNLHGELYAIEFERMADNFSLRENTPANRRNRAEIERTERGIKLGADLHLAGRQYRLGMGYKRIRHDAQRFGGPGPVSGNLNLTTSYQYPGVKLDKFIVDADTVFTLSAATRLTTGLKWEYVDSDASKAGLKATNPGAGNRSTLDFYRRYYGAVEPAHKDSGLSAKALLDYTPEGENWNGYASIGYLQRSPNFQERYFAAQPFFLAGPPANGPMGTSAGGFGNPGIDWEKHRRLEVGADIRSTDWIAYGRKIGTSTPWKLRTSFYYDDVADFISRDRAHGQTATGVNDNARIWRNVDAILYGFELDLQISLSRHLASRVNLQGSHGRNNSDGRDLYGIRPLELNWLVDYSNYLSTGGSWNIGARLRLVAAQSNVDADPRLGSGYDAGKTEAFSVADLYGGIQLHDRVALRLGINNLFDEEYAEPHAHNVMEGNPYLVDSPGRHFFAAITANF